ncbi:MAG: carbonate dehydratase [Gammaproteobacteria bacterium]|nr:carbonate dehydratase [Gammaproteobacteria bacterium]
MPVIQDLLANNRHWAASRASQDPDFFPRLSRQQNPDFLWIGCADSRVPANEIVGMDPGELFVHRNVANLVLPSDLNCLAVIQYAVEVLNVEHIIVCGHYGCGGVRAAMQDRQLGLIDNWLQPIRRLCERHAEELAGLASDTARVDRLCELNVVAQARSVAATTIVQNAWHRGQPLAVHAWVYALADGLIRDLGDTLRGIDDLAPNQRLRALE